MESAKIRTFVRSLSPYRLLTHSHQTRNYSTNTVVKLTMHFVSDTFQGFHSVKEQFENVGFVLFFTHPLPSHRPPAGKANIMSKLFDRNDQNPVTISEILAAKLMAECKGSSRF